MTRTLKPQNKFKYKRVRIYWQDIVSNSEWMSLDKAKDQVYSWCEDTGYLLHKDPKKLIIFASHSFDDDGTLDPVEPPAALHGCIGGCTSVTVCDD